jgi:hypothetical protein
MRALKIVALGGAILFCVSSTVGIAAAIYANTSWLRNEIYLSCTIESNPDYEGGFNWTLIIDKRNETVKWEGWGTPEKQRTTEYLTASAIRMNWKSKEGNKVILQVNRLDGSFRLEIADDEKTPNLYGHCYERQPQF